ncbi:MAG TPA: alpha/beta fold hydrolase [Pyrinomonadaceae bacterium]|jgi:predicted alpha/beta-hydrolase family hydrolase|nr:alpha/beta fold hydrolase [Pyrinomonadaceae bacterium]
MMISDPDSLTITINERDSVTALLYHASRKARVGVTLILGHGAGAGQLHPFMSLFASGLAERGIDTMTFNFIYMEQRRGAPDPKAKLEACYQAVIDAALKHKKLKGNRLAIGGKSMGGRIASQVAAQPESSSEIAALVFLGYPLHPPGRPDKLRDAHLPDIKAPMLFIQGERDAFGTPDELRAVFEKHHLKPTLHAIAGGDHSLKVPKSLGPQEQLYTSTMDTIAAWLQTNTR